LNNSFNSDSFTGNYSLPVWNVTISVCERERERESVCGEYLLGYVYVVRHVRLIFVYIHTHTVYAHLNVTIMFSSTPVANRPQSLLCVCVCVCLKNMAARQHGSGDREFRNAALHFSTFTSAFSTACTHIKELRRTVFCATCF